MPNSLFRFLISILGLAPMSFAILVAKPSSKSSAETSLSAVSLNFLYALAICAVALIILKLTISLAKNHFNDIFIEESQILSISQRRNGLLPYFLSYIMPIFLGESAAMPFWIFCIVTILIASALSSGISNNPMLYALGFKFYDIQMRSRINLLYISKESPQSIITNGIRAFQFESDTLIQRI